MAMYCVPSRAPMPTDPQWERGERPDVIPCECETMGGWMPEVVPVRGNAWVAVSSLTAMIGAAACAVSLVLPSVTGVMIGAAVFALGVAATIISRTGGKEMGTSVCLANRDQVLTGTPRGARIERHANGSDYAVWEERQAHDPAEQTSGVAGILIGGAICTASLIFTPTNLHAVIGLFVGGAVCISGLMSLARAGERTVERSQVLPHDRTCDNIIDDRHSHYAEPARVEPARHTRHIEAPAQAVLTRSAQPEQAGFIPVERGGNWLKDYVEGEWQESER